MVFAAKARIGARADQGAALVLDRQPFALSRPPPPCHQVGARRVGEPARPTSTDQREGGALVYDNGREPILMSEQPYPVHFEQGERKSILCPDCCTLRRVKQNLIVRHDAPDGAADCAGSFQRVVFDVTAQQEREMQAARAAGLVSGRRTAADTPLLPVDAACRVAEVLRAHMCTGRLRPGQCLPPVAEIAGRLRTDENAVRRAVTLLRGEQLVVTCPGGGSVVSTRAAALPAEAAAQYRLRAARPLDPAVHQLAGARMVVDVLRMHMRSGRLRPGRRLPHAEVLARCFETSEAAARYALSLLHEQQLLSLGPSERFHVSAAAPRLLERAA